jgi:adenosylcobinamide-phosphate synthase
MVLLVLLLDAAAGDPDWLYRRLPHPVVLLGKLIDSIEHRLNAGGASWQRWCRRTLGALAVVLTLAVAIVVGVALHEVCSLVPAPWNWLLEAVFASTLIAARGLYLHVRAVAVGLRQSLQQGRAAVSAIVGRDPQSLDEAGVARAAIESLAENFSDGVVAPVFWFALLGLPGLVAYKAINTLDSMIGHHSERYEDFGKVAAGLDDVVNLVPARLAGLSVVVGAVLVPGANAGRAYASMLRFAPLHRSPNAGWQEAAFAGGLGFALAGPRRYPGEVVDDAWMGDGRSALTPADIEKSLHLYLCANAVMAALFAGLWLAL